MIAVAGGTFWMGSNEGSFRQNERVHEVRLPSFFISETEVTQDLWQAVMGTNPSIFKGPDNPVENVSWYDAVRFCNALSELCGLAPAYTIEGETVTWNRQAKGYRLPTEAEWEYAARGGQSGATGDPLSIAAYSGGATAMEIAWYGGNAGKRTQPVKGKAPNELGLYDMSGNVWEWCWDWFGDYPTDYAYNPAGPDTGFKRVYRGGSWFNAANQLRVTFRICDPPASKAKSLGFRLAQNW
jgi:formylglycine-generating enzyme required for sulfatase activity